MITLLQQLQRVTQVDIDSFDANAVEDSWNCIDATSNQAEIYTQISKPENSHLLQQSIEMAREMSTQFPECCERQLAADICTIHLASRMASKVPGAIHVMANPVSAFNSDAVVSHGRRYRDLILKIDRSFAASRLVIKVAATWEGLQACRQLKEEGISTLATVVFGMEQAILAGEVGCISISPFLHELKTHFDEGYVDEGPFLATCRSSQAYFAQQSLSTKVKACANLGVDEAMELAGISSFTIMLDDLVKMTSTQSSDQHAPKHAKAVESNGHLLPKDEPKYLNDESKFRCDFASGDCGKNQYRVAQALSIFGDYQDKLLTLMEGSTASCSVNTTV